MEPILMRLVAVCATHGETVVWSHPAAVNPLSLAVAEAAVDAVMDATGMLKMACARCAVPPPLLRLYEGSVVLEAYSPPEFEARHHLQGLPPALQSVEPAPARVRRHLRIVEEAYPQVWRQSEQMRQQRGRTLPLWPGHVYVPVAGARSLVRKLVLSAP
jgi:hypothetical protein